MCPVQAAELHSPQRSATAAELIDLQKIMEELRDLASYLAKHELEHEAGYVMMAFNGVYKRLGRVVDGRGQEAD